LIPSNRQWVTNEFATAPEDKALILALHHPVYSFDDHHSGSAAMADAVQHAINDSRRVPNLVLTAHVHNYQRIERHIDGKMAIPFIVAGAGGYYHLHGTTADNGHVDRDLGAKLMFHDQYHHSYVLISVDKDNITGTMIPIAETGSSKHKHDAEPDTFRYPAQLIKLEDGVIVSL